VDRQTLHLGDHCVLPGALRIGRCSTRRAAFALLSMTLFMVGMGLITYRFGFGMKQNQRSVMALGMGTRNIAAVLAAACHSERGPANCGDDHHVDFVVRCPRGHWLLKIFAKLAGKTVVGSGEHYRSVSKQIQAAGHPAYQVTRRPGPMNKTAITAGLGDGAMKYKRRNQMKKNVGKRK
jgi:hypothetical protein